MTNNNIYELPKTATISYYDVETDQNLTFEEWKELNSTNSNEIKVISKSGGDFISEKEGYGPCIDNKNCSCGYMKGKSISAYEDKLNGVKLFTTGVGIDGSILPTETPHWAEVGVRSSILTYEDSVSAIRVGVGNLGVCSGNGVGMEVSLNLVEGDLGPFNGSLGLSANTGASVKDKSINLNAAGWGVTVGRKMAINTSFGSVGIDFGFFLKK